MHVGGHESSPAGQPHLASQGLGRLDGRPGEVQAHGIERRMHAHQVERVQPEVALKVGQA